MLCLSSIFLLQLGHVFLENWTSKSPEWNIIFEDSQLHELGILSSTCTPSSDPLMCSSDYLDYDYDYNEDVEVDKISKRDYNSKDKPEDIGIVCKRRNKTIRSSPPAFRKPKSRMQTLVASSLGHRVELFCLHRKGCPKAIIKWMKDGEALKSRSRESGLSTVRIKAKGELIIEDNRKEDDGNYTCVISNSLGSINHTIRVMSVKRTVAMKPQVLPDQPGNHTIVVGSNFTLLCEPRVSTPDSIVWFKHYQVDGAWVDEKSDKAFVNILQYTNSKPPPEDDQRLVLVNVTFTDSGLYSCRVSNQYGSTISSGLVSVIEKIEDEQSIHENSMYEYAWIVVVFVIVAISLSFSTILYKYRKRYEYEKQKKNEVLQGAECVVKWVKKIIVEKELLLRNNDELPIPIIRMEKEKVLVPESDLSRTEIGELNAETFEFQLDVDWEFPRELIGLGEKLGQGAFGRVVRGTAFNSKFRPNLGCTSPLTIASPESEPIEVAIKMLHDDYMDSNVLDLVKEIEIMKIVGGHVNIVNLLGACTQPPGKPLYAIIEYAEFGNLRDYLLKRRCNNIISQAEVLPSISLRQLVNFSWQIARGMEFLSSKKCIHRDLAARNVLVAKDAVVKIADFGLARYTQESDYYRMRSEGKLPVLWMSPESLFEGVSTTMSDVWSFGILLWEIITLGDRPYQGLAMEAVFDLIQNGYRMASPPQCPPVFYQIMMKCWQHEPTSRPSWSELVYNLHSLFDRTLPGMYLSVDLPLVPTPPSTPGSSQKTSVSSDATLPIDRSSTPTKESSLCYEGISSLRKLNDYDLSSMATAVDSSYSNSYKTPTRLRRMTDESGYTSYAPADDVDYIPSYYDMV